MTYVAYYNMSGKANRLGLLDGILVEVDEIIESALRMHAVSDLIGSVSLKIKEKDIDPIGVSSPKKWEDYMTLLIWSISGKEPLRQEVLRGRQIIAALPSYIKKHPGFPRFVFGFLPFMLIGFKTHLENKFQSGSNNIHDVVEFILRLSIMSSQKIESFLCAHRGKGGGEKFYLVDDVEINKASIALNLSSSLLANNPWAKKCSVEWFQQGPTEFACLNMFPEMFLRYIVSGDISGLLEKLRRHVCQIKTLAIEESGNALFSVSESDQRSLWVLTYISERYGQQWRSTDFSLSIFNNDPIVKIALADTLPLIMRLMPFYLDQQAYKEHLRNKKIYIENNIEKAKAAQSEFSQDLICSSIERFYEIQKMHPTAKALYETVLYYLWGQHSEKFGVFSVGLDRDHAEFQNKAWLLGVNDVRGSLHAGSNPSSLLYARRNGEAENCSQMLKDFSVRQFWR